MLVALNLPDHALCGCLRSEIGRVLAQTVHPAVHRQLSPTNIVSRVAEMNVKRVRAPTEFPPVHDFPACPRFAVRRPSSCLSTILACSLGGSEVSNNRITVLLLPLRVWRCDEIYPRRGSPPRPPQRQLHRDRRSTQ